jgi:hypothetical protein
MNAADVHLKEYEVLKAEQGKRIGVRDNLLFGNFIAIGSITAGAVQAHLTVALLLIAPVCAVLGWVYLANDAKVSHIGHYVGDVLAPKIGRHVGDSVLAWDTGLRPNHRGARYGWLAVDVTAFGLPGLVATGIFTFTAASHLPWPFIIVSAVEEAVSVAFIIYIVTHEMR